MSVVGHACLQICCVPALPGGSSDKPVHMSAVISDIKQRQNTPVCMQTPEGDAGRPACMSAVSQHGHTLPEVSAVM